jgi:rod shape-determining protein MreC
MVAQVIGKSPTLWEAWVLIDKGSADGLRVDMPVVGATPTVGETLVGKGLVGRITEITAHTAKVLLITDAQSSVAAKIQGSRAEGIVEGSVSGVLVMDFVDRDLAIEPKLVVVSSGYGGVYPADVPIGIVSSVGEETINIYKEIEVQPFVDFGVLEEVMVLMVPEPEAAEASTTTTGQSPDTVTAGGNGTSSPAGTSPGGQTAPETSSTSTTAPVTTTTTNGEGGR